ncbi:MAG: M24 family metallopeptidase [Thermomicrobiales bacterium]
MKLPFERSEYLERLGKTKQRMEDAGIDVLLISNEDNMNYLSGYDGYSSYVPQFLFVASDEEEPLWVGRAMDDACARNSVFMDHSRIIGYPEKYIGNPDLHPQAFMADLLRERGWANRRLGVELDTEPFSPYSYNQLQRRLPEGQFVDAGLLVNWTRLVKSPQELTYMRQAGVIADLAMQTAADTIAEGVRQCDAAAAVVAALIRGTDEFGGDVPHKPAMATGPRSSSPHLTWTEDRYKPGEATNIELGGARHRYHCGLSRTIVVGQPDPKLANLAPIVGEGMGVALDVARAGATCEEVEAVFRAFTKERGAFKPSRIGYAIGNGWAERTASLQPGDKTVLEPNMTFHMMLGFWEGDWGYVCSEVFRVKDAGPPETLSSLPRELFVNA